MSTELVGVVGVVLWLMVMAAQLRRRRRVVSPRDALRRARPRGPGPL